MKPRILVLLAVAATIGFGYWLAESSRDDREIWVSIGAWILGFWCAASILGVSAGSDSSEEDDEGEEDEEYDEEDDDYDEEED